jgi:hypothetical protein
MFHKAVIAIVLVPLVGTLSSRTETAARGGGGAQGGDISYSRAAAYYAESEAKRPPIPTESGHRFRSKAATQSERRRPPC